MGSKSKSKAAPRRVRVPRKLVEPVFNVYNPTAEDCISIGSESDDSLFEELARRPSIVKFCLDRNLEHPPGPINTPKGGFVNKCPPAPQRGILKC